MAPTKLSGPNLCSACILGQIGGVISYYTNQNVDLTSCLEVKQEKKKRGKLLKMSSMDPWGKKSYIQTLLREARTNFQISTAHVVPSAAETADGLTLT